MAFANPFTPMFGGKPESFFGRQDIIRPFDIALTTPGSDFRTLFFTGTRGSGKTCLLRQLSISASNHGWDVIELPADHAQRALLKRLAPYDERTSVDQPSAALQVMGFGGRGQSETVRIGPEDLPQLLIERCEIAPKGVMVVIDEVQKVPIDDISTLCTSFQMASSHGCDAILAVAGLPYAHAQIIHHEGCTFMRRARHISIGLMSRDEVSEAFVQVFGRLEEVELDPEGLTRLVEASSGQPYLMQLLGFEIVERARERLASALEVVPYRVDVPAVDGAFAAAYDVYSRQALEPILAETGRAGKRFLRAMADVMDERHVARRRDIAEALGISATSVSSTRKRLLDQGIIVAPRSGSLRFNIPYLRRFVEEGRPQDTEALRSEEWDV